MATALTDVAQTDHDAAVAQYPAFMAQFEKLEKALDANSNVIEDAGVKQKDAAETLAKRSKIEIVVLALIASALFGVVARVLVRGVVRGVQAERDAVAETSTSLAGMSRSVGADATHAQQQTAVLVAGADQVNANVAALASAVEEMGASIGEISTSAGNAANVAAEAMSTVDRTTVVVGQLGASSSEIGKVLDVITSIAEQTNLLALNATIEAARAGDAGKGFAVVANEVKELAKETASATEEIASRIGAIQTDTQQAVDAIAQISAVMTQINDFQNTIASAVEEQTATTNEIAGNLADVARLTEDSMTGIHNVARVTEQAVRTAEESERLAASLSSTTAPSSSYSAPSMESNHVQAPRRFLLDAPAPFEDAARETV
jgi:methyl-accepting chemotaxis protein